MSRQIYLKPAGVFADDATARDSHQSDHVEPIAGRADLVFTQLDILERTAATSKRRLMAVAGSTGFKSQDRSAPPFNGDRIWDDFDKIIAPRTAIAGLTMDRTRIMGIVNVTPDSFSDGGRLSTVDAAVDHALRLVEQGADILDIGGESTRPGAEPVAPDEELRRVIPVIERIRAKSTAVISVDTRKSVVMRRAAAAGADILNDVSALTHDPDALATAVETGLPVMLMHAQGDPRTMNDDPRYRDVALDVFDFLDGRIEVCVAAGIARSKIIADPGIGFGKHLHHNVAVMSALALYHGLGVPLLLGASRKKMIGQLCDVVSPSDRLPGSLACALAGASQGVQIVRVHDVAETKQALSVWHASMTGREAAANKKEG